MDLIHRLPKAALVTIVAFLFFGGTVGVVMAAGSEPLPDEFGIAEPMEGDRWEYTATFGMTSDNLEVQAELNGEEAEDPDDFNTEVTGLEWLPAEVIYDRDGVPRHAHPLVEVGVDRKTYVAVDDHRAIATSFAHSFEEPRGGSSTSILGMFETGSTRQATSEEEIIGYFDEAAPCSFFTDLQGQVLPMDQPVRVLGSCLGFEEQHQETWFDAVEVQSYQGMDAVVLEAKDDQNVTRLWYAPDIPYPVRLEFMAVFDLSELNGDDDGGLQLEGTLTAAVDAELTGFSPGDKPWGDDTAPLPATLSPVQVAPTSVTGPNDSGVDHPFLLSEAYQGAMTDLTFSNLRDWMEQHPDAVMVKASHWAEVDGDYDVHTWRFRMWTDESGPGEGSEQYWTEVEAERRIAHAGTPAETLQSVAGPQESYGAGSPQGFQFNLFNGASWDKIPTQAPSVASAMGRFEEATGNQATTYGFDYTCEFWCWFDQPDALMVGREVVSQEAADPINGGSGSIDTTRHLFRFDSEGRMTSQERKQQHEDTWTAGLLGQTGSTPQSHVDEDSMPPATRPVWSAPPPEAAAGVGFVAFIIGAAYWFWPTLKALPFLGGFSRVRSEQMLLNPIRAQVYETIQTEPGIHYQALVRAVDKGSSVVDHHLRKLQQGGYIVVQKGQGFTCFFPQGEVDHHIMVAVPALKTEGASRILKELVAHPGQNVSNLAETMGIAKSTVSYHVGRLRKAHLLEDGRMLTPTDDAEKALIYAA